MTTTMAAATMEATSTVRSTTMKSTAAVEPAATMKSVSSMEAITTVKAAAIPAMSTDKSMSAYKAAPMEATIPAAPAIPTPAIPTPAFTTPTPAIMTEAVVPRARTDKHASYEPIRSVVAVRRASVRIVIVIAISADRSGAVIAGTNPHADCDLRLRIGRRQRQHHRKQRQIFEITHFATPLIRPSFKAGRIWMPFLSGHPAYHYEPVPKQKVAGGKG